MYFTYEKLWHLLLDKKMTREDLRQRCGISSNTIAKLGKNKNVTTDILLKICIALPPCFLLLFSASLRRPCGNSIPRAAAADNKQTLAGV